MKINKKITTKPIILLIFISFVLFPTIALASWWNPFSWNVWSNIFHKTNTKTQVLENRVKELEKKLGDIATSSNEFNAEATTTVVKKTVTEEIKKPAPIDNSVAIQAQAKLKVQVEKDALLAKQKADEQARIDAVRKQSEAEALKKTQEEAKIKAEQELQGQQEQAQTKIYADSIIKACGLIINQCEILKSYNTDEIINLIDIRINGINELKATNAKYLNIVEFQTLDKILDSQIEFAKASRVLVVNLETKQETEKNCQEIINNVNDISKTMQILILYKGKNKAKITEDDFNQYWGFLQGYQNGINKFWNVIKSGNANIVQAFKESVDSQDARLKTFLSSIEQRYSVPIPSGIYYSPSQNRFLEDYYLQEQSKSLQNMSDSLRGILDMVKFQYAPRL